MILLHPNKKKREEEELQTAQQKRKNKDWTIPEAENPECPDFCGDPMEFEPFAHDPKTGITVDKGVGVKTFYRVHRPDWIAPMTKAVEEIDKHGGMDGNSYCTVFSSCSNQDNPMQSRHSTPYMVCSDYDMIHASNILVGSASERLPGYLAEEGDHNQFCLMARFIAHLVETTIFPSAAGWHNKKCIVQDFFINQQLTGSHTNMHVHRDDTYGGVFYLDVPEDTKLCFSDSETHRFKKRWWKHAPEFTERLFPEEPTGRYPGYVTPKAGDVVFFPVAWTEHWVPKLNFSTNEKRTSVVFNMVCI